MKQDDFREAFVGEAQELLATANAQALVLEAALRDGTQQGRAVREMFRAVHTIKGLASMVGVEPIVAIAHTLEEVLRHADRNNVLLSQRAVDALIAALEAITQRVQSVHKGESVAEPPAELLATLTATDSTPAPVAAAAESVFLLDDAVASRLNAGDRQQLVQAAAEGKRAVRIDFAPSPALAEQGHSITSVRTRLGTVADIVKVVPMTDKAAQSGLAFVLLAVTTTDDEALRHAVGAPIGGPHPIVSVRKTEPARDLSLQTDAVRVDVGRLDVALDRLSDLVITRFRLNSAAAALKDKGADVRELMEVLADNARQLRDLRAAVLRVRMVPLDELFGRMRLLVRGLTRANAKRINLQLDARGAELDKTVAEHVFPALVHLARNAVDHGIEPAHERARQGKPAEATLELACRQVSSTQIEITVRDDGRGIDVDKVLHRAGAAPGTPLLDVLCRPGFSTRDEADTASGRGMGMDIVRRAIVEQLGGDLSLETVLGQGTRFLLRVPLTIAIVDAFVFRCGTQRFVTPNAAIEEAIDIGTISHPHGGNFGVIVHRGSAVPFVELTDLLRMPKTVRSPQAFLVRKNGELLALGVDKILTQQEIVVRPIEDKLVKAPGINGATDLGDGTPTLVLDLTRIAARAA